MHTLHPRVPILAKIVRTRQSGHIIIIFRRVCDSRGMTTMCRWGLTQAHTEHTAAEERKNIIFSPRCVNLNVKVRN